MTDLYERDPEEIGPEHPDDLNARMNFIESRHEFTPGLDGKCMAPSRKYCYIHNITDECQPCRADEWSVLHIDDYRDNHDHGGADCMCFENRDY